MNLTFVVLAAGQSTRYGFLKQLDPVGPHGAVLLDYAIFDAVRAGFSRIVVVIREEQRPVFEDHFRQQFGNRPKIELVAQRLHDLPAGAPPVATRRRPWGTAHAVLSASQQVSNPFGVANSDDFYSADAYQILADFLSKTDPRSADFGVVGYPLRDTLSAHGGVSRATLETGPDTGARLVEILDISERDDIITGITAGGEPCTLKGDEMVSMNLWGFTPAVFPALKNQLLTFLENKGTDPDSEFLLSTAIDQQVGTGSAALSALPASDRWFGMTFQQDKAEVKAKIQDLIDRGIYPTRLSDGLR